MNKRTIIFLLLAILLVGALLRLAGYNAASYTDDEIRIIDASEQIAAADVNVFDSLAIQSLYPKFLVWWRSVFAAERWDRLPSLLLGVVAIWLTYLFVAEALRFGKGSETGRASLLKYAPLLAAAFVALNPPLVALSWRISPLAPLPALVAFSMLAFAKVAREAAVPAGLRLNRTIPWLALWLAVGVLGCAIHPYFCLLAIGQAVAAAFLPTRSARMSLPIVVFALMSASFVWLAMIETAGSNVFALARKTNAQGLLALFDGGFVGLSASSHTAWYSVAILAAAGLLLGGALFSLFIRSGRNDLRDLCLPCIIPALAVFLATPALLMPLSDPALIVAIVPVVLAAAAGGICLWNNRGVLFGAALAVALLSGVAYGLALNERRALPDYRPVLCYLEANASDSPVVHLSLDTYRYVGLYRGSTLDYRWEQLWLIENPLIRQDILAEGEEIFVVSDAALIGAMFGGDEAKFLKQILMPDWEVVETKVFGYYTVYRIKKPERPKEFKPPEMGWT